MLNKDVDCRQLGYDLDRSKGYGFGYFEEEAVAALLRYMQENMPYEDYEPETLGAYFECYGDMDDYNEDLDFPYDDLEELAEDHTVIVYNGGFLVTYHPAPFIWGLFDYRK